MVVIMNCIYYIVLHNDELIMLCNSHYINYIAESKLCLYFCVAMEGIIGVLCKLFD